MKPTLRRAILDTNLLLLWLVARTDASLLRSFKRVQAFTYEDIDLLRDVLKPYPDLITTPHVLSETSNFVDQAPAWRRQALVDELKTYIQTVTEIHKPADLLILRSEFNLFGLTDTAMAHLSTDAMVINHRLPACRQDRSTGGQHDQFQSLSEGASSLASATAFPFVRKSSR